jgi:hypothetical protein
MKTPFLLVLPSLLAVSAFGTSIGTFTCTSATSSDCSVLGIQPDQPFLGVVNTASLTWSLDPFHKIAVLDVNVGFDVEHFLNLTGQDWTLRYTGSGTLTESFMVTGTNLPVSVSIGSPGLFFIGGIGGCCQGDVPFITGFQLSDGSNIAGALTVNPGQIVTVVASYSFNLHNILGHPVGDCPGCTNAAFAQWETLQGGLITASCDTCQIVAVPEPSTWALVVAGAFLGLLALQFARSHAALRRWR